MLNRDYLFRLISHASLKKFGNVLQEIHRRSGKSRVIAFFDILNCMVKYGAGYYDYLIFAFYDLNKGQRKTYLTRLISKKLNLFMNDPVYCHILDNKDEFYNIFREYIGREYLQLEQASREEVKRFAEQRSSVFCKVRDKECGIGCERLVPGEFPSFDEFYTYVRSKGFCTMEDNVKQHDSLSKMFPNAVNTMRVITLLDPQGKPHCLYAAQKFGLGESVVDNNCMFSPVDLETGRLKYPAHSGDTRKGLVYQEHPNSHIPIVGYQLPFVQETVSLCLKAAQVVPQLRYVGWDVAITPSGPVLIEGNTYCAHDFWQLPPHTPDKIGILPKIKEIAPDFPC